MTGTGLGGGLHAGAPPFGGRPDSGRSCAAIGGPRELGGQSYGCRATEPPLREAALNLWACRPPASPAWIPSPPLPAERGVPHNHGFPPDLSPAQLSTTETTRTTSDLGAVDA